MRSLFLFCVCIYVVAGQNVNEMANLPKYDERYDYLDVDALFNSKRLVRNYVDCLISASRCTPEGKALKKLLPEALRTKCVRCTERQKRTAVKVIKRLKYEYPEEWAKLSSRWDPTGDFTRYFEEFLAKEHFNTIAGSAGNEIPGSSPPSPPPPPPQPPLTNPPPTMPQPIPTTPPRPVILNRFGDDGELMMGSPSSAAGTTRPTTPPTMRPMSPTTMRPMMQPRPTMVWTAAASDAMPTRFPLRPNKDLSPPYTTAITLIDQIGYKIIRTTELVTDILRNTVRAVVGRPTMVWTAAASDAMPTRFPLRPNKDLSPPYTTAITLIDQIGYKIIRTTELVTDILRNTVRAVVGRPTMVWTAAASDAMPTRFPLRPNKDLSPPYTTAITLIDQIGYKIIRTTELVTDILRNTVRAVVGR